LDPFHSREESRLAGKDGKLMHASIRIGDSSVMIVDEMPQMGSLGPKSLKGSPVTIPLCVENADDFVEAGSRTAVAIAAPGMTG
jgi:uncharacterized glyoxalase superfamily protein PhnB